ncbi:hypothetical protein [Brachybacterium conglomeratum]|uniref:hypothetical protein n=1 Tax=Brachybacterium conglomeratum TaxID=47846 RepID=UPI003DA17F2A
MGNRQTLRMGAMVRWGDVRIGVMSVTDEPGAENARLKVMSPVGSTTVRVPLGGSAEVDGVGTVSLHKLNLHHPSEDDSPDVTGRGNVEVSFRASDHAEHGGEER